MIIIWQMVEVHTLHGRYRGSLVFKRNYILAKKTIKYVCHTNTHTHIR